MAAVGTTRRAVLRGGVFAAGVATGVPALVACAGSATSGGASAPAGKLQGTIEYWFSVGAAREPMIMEMVRSFQAQQPQVQVAPWSAPDDGALRDKIVAAAAGGTPPDVAFMNVPQF